MDNNLNEFINQKNNNILHSEKMKQYTNTNNSVVNEIANMFIAKCEMLDTLYDLYIKTFLIEKQTNITVSKRSSDYHACLENYPEIWGSGRNIYEAVGNVIMNHPDKFNLKIIEE